MKAKTDAGLPSGAVTTLGPPVLPGAMTALLALGETAKQPGPAQSPVELVDLRAGRDPGLSGRPGPGVGRGYVGNRLDAATKQVAGARG